MTVCRKTNKQGVVWPCTLAWLHIMKAISVSMDVGPRYVRCGRAYCVITFLWLHRHTCRVK